MWDNRKIGVIDSGVGGLTVAREFRKLLPEENIMYLGDNENVPYGNKSEEEIYKLTKNMVDFLMEEEVKLIVVACNTISSILDKYFLDSPIPIISIIGPARDYVIREKLQKVGVIATKFTIESGTYERLIRERDKDIVVISEPCPTLAEIIDKGQYTDEEIEEVINIHMKNILAKGDLENIILGCTHYPIVLENFKKIAPDINFINPAYEQVIHVKELMKETNIKGDCQESTFEIFTSGDMDVYLNMIENLSMELPDKIQKREKIKGF